MDPNTPILNEEVFNKKIDLLTESQSTSIVTGPKWIWCVFGSEMLVVRCVEDIPLWRRILCRIFLGSKFKRIKE